MGKNSKYMFEFFTVILAVIIVNSTPVFSSPLKLISNFMEEEQSFDGPDPPFSVNWSDPTSIDTSFIGVFLNASGVYDDIFGPGIDGWDNHVEVSNQNLTVQSQASAVGAVEADVDIWDWFNEPQIITDKFLWGSTYELDGTQGTSYQIDMDIDFDYTYYNLALDGMSTSTASTEVIAFTLPALEKGNYSSDPHEIVSNITADSNYVKNFDNLVSKSLFFQKSYDGIDMHIEATGHQEKTINLANLESGDRLYVIGGLSASTKCDINGPGLSVATMFPSQTSTLLVNGALPLTAPVPEPTTITLLGLGLIGLVCFNRRK